MRKRGEMVSSSAVEIIIAVAAVSVLIFLLFRLFAPDYYLPNEVAESYFERLESEVDSVRDGESGEFVLFDNGEDDLNFYLVYFGGVAQFNYGKKHFSSKGGRNIACVCYEDENIVCKHCSGFDLAFSFDKNKSDVQVFEEGVSFEISREGDYYEFSKR